MSRPRQFAHRLRPVARRAVETVERSSALNGLATSILLAVARRSGAPDLLLRQPQIASPATPLRTRIATCRLVRRLARGDVASVSSMFYKFGARPTDEQRWAVYELVGFATAGIDATDPSEKLIEQLERDVLAELDTMGDSTILDWLAGRHDLDADDPTLRRLTTQRVHTAIAAAQKSADALVDSDASERARGVVVALASACSDRGLFVAGRTLLQLERDGVVDPSTLEFGAFDTRATDQRTLGLAQAVVRNRSDDSLLVEHIPTGLTATILTYRALDDHIACRSAVSTVRHTPFDLRSADLDGDMINVPDDVDRFLDEVFGNWKTPPAFFDRSLESPKATITQSADAMKHLGRRTAAAIRSGDRWNAQVGTQLLAQHFGVDFTFTMPKSSHPKTLAKPLLAATIRDDEVVVVAGAFDELTVGQLQRLGRVVRPSRFVVVAVNDGVGRTDPNERLQALRTLKAVDHAILYSSSDELADHLARLSPHRLILDADSGVDEAAHEAPGIVVEVTA